MNEEKHEQEIPVIIFHVCSPIAGFSTQVGSFFIRFTPDDNGVVGRLIDISWCSHSRSD